jgi:hypothetical protein
MTLNKVFIDPAGDKSRGSILVPPGTDSPRRMSAILVQLCAVAIFLSPGLRETLSYRWLVWLGRHSFAVYLVHGTILRSVGMWIVYGITGEPWEPAGLKEDGTPKDQEWIHPKSTMHIRIAVVVFVILTYTAAWAWVRYVDSTCLKATIWLEKKVFDDGDESSGGKEGHAEKGYLNGLPYLNTHHARGFGYTTGDKFIKEHGAKRSADSERSQLSP